MPADVHLLRTYAQTRDAGIFQQIVAAYTDMVYGTCLRILGNRDDAEDATQETFWRLARESKSISTSVGAWLHRCATNECLTRKRRRVTKVSRELAYEQRKAAEKSESATWADVAGEVDKAMEELPEDLRCLLVAHFLEQKTQAQLGGELGVSPATLSRRIGEAVETVRKKLRQNGAMFNVAGFGLLFSGHAVPATLAIGLGKMAIAGPTAIVHAAGWGVKLKVAGIALILGLNVALLIAFWPKPAHRPAASIGSSAVGGSIPSAAGFSSTGPISNGPRLFPTGPDQRLTPEKEAILHAAGTWDVQPYIDFDTGGVYAQNQGWTNHTAGPSHDWQRDAGVDAVAIVRFREIAPQTVAPMCVLEGRNIQAWPINNERFDTMENEIRDPSILTANSVQPQLSFTPQDVANRPGNYPATFLFVTAAGSQGVVQITAIPEEPPALHVRYRLWQNLPAPPAPPLAAALVSSNSQANLTFGPPVQVALAKPHSAEPSALNLDTGEVFIRSAGVDDLRAWVRQSGADLFTVTDESGRLISLGTDQLIALPLTAAAWDNLSAADAAAIIARQSAPDPTNPELLLAHQFSNPIAPRGAPTWLIQTRDHHTALLQISTLKESTVTVRYKLLQGN